VKYKEVNGKTFAGAHQVSAKIRMATKDFNIGIKAQGSDGQGERNMN